MSFEMILGKKKIIIPEEKIFQIPEPTDNPLIFWLWNPELKPAFTIRESSLIIMNLYSVKEMKDCDADMVGSSLFLSAVLVEELTHCATLSLRNHKNWNKWLEHLQEELHGNE
jgi:hypothetical protein